MEKKIKRNKKKIMRAQRKNPKMKKQKKLDLVRPKEKKRNQIS